MSPEDRIFNDLTAMHQSVGVLSTLGDYNQPQASSLYFVFDSALNIYFITRKASRNWMNIKRNPRVAFVISSQNPPLIVQLEGKAMEVTDAQEISEHFSRLIALASEKQAAPPANQIEDGKMVFMKILTDWVRSGDFETLKEGDKFVETTLL